MNDATPLHPMDELELRQDEVIRELDALNDRIEQVLSQWLSGNAAA